ncbi:hypothetical protein LTS09_018214 [Friedmanniomyces endolithicus]|nr:hypothetical protein LTS09_018214 [Friedmanniomyces endolithicus]
MATSHAQPSRPLASRNDFEVAIVCALPEERETVEALMTKHFRSEGYTYGKAKGNDNSYTLGLLGGKPVVLVAPRDMGTTNTARGLHISFPNIMYAWVVGIAGGATFTHDGKEWKESDIYLGRRHQHAGDRFVRGRSEAFNRILRKINADLAGYSKLQTGPCEFTTTPVRTRIL